MGKSCFFIGHRDADSDLLLHLNREVVRHINELGVTEFIVGGYGAFDRMAAHAVINAKTVYSDIILTLLLPYHPSERPIELPNGFDGSFYPPGMETIPRRFAIVRANRYLIDHVDYLIAFAWRPGSNAKALTDYAQNKAVEITNIATSCL